jgi:anti-anti-sigma factor
MISIVVLPEAGKASKRQSVVIRGQASYTCADFSVLLGVAVGDLEDPHVIRFAGECDVSSYPQLRALLESVPLSARRILIDLTETTIVDSTSLAELLFAKRRWEREGRRAAVVTSNKHVYRLMSIANVLGKLRVFEDAEAAARYLRADNER